AVVALVATGVMLAGTVLLFLRVPGGLVPAEDQGSLFVVALLPPAASLERTRALTAQVTEGRMKNPAVSGAITFSGFDLLSRAQKTSSGIAFVTLKDWSERTDPKLDARNLAPGFASLNATFRDGFVMGINPPPIIGMSTTGGFEYFLQDRSGGSL